MKKQNLCLTTFFLVFAMSYIICIFCGFCRLIGSEKCECAKVCVLNKNTIQNEITPNIKNLKNISINHKKEELLRIENSEEETPSNSESSAYEYIIKNVQELLDGIDLSGLDEEFSGVEYFNYDGSGKDVIVELIKGNLNVDGFDFLKNLTNVFFSSLGNLSGYFAIIIAIAILSCIINAVKPKFMDKSLTDLTHFVCIVTVICIVASLFNEVYKSAMGTSTVLEKQSEVIFPIMLTLLTACGATSTPLVLKPQMIFLLKILNFVVRKLLLPITLLLFIFEAVGALGDKYKFEKQRKLLKSVFKWIAGLTVVLFNFLITSQGIVSSMYDGVSIKALKYALGNSIPFVGSIVNGGFDVVLSSLVLIKNAVGSFALLGVLVQVFNPVIKICVFTLFLRLTSALIEPIADVRLSSFLSNVADTGGYLTAIIAVGSSSYFITILFVINSLGGVI